MNSRFRLRPPVVPKATENDIERDVCGLCRRRGYYVVRLQSGLLKTPDGRWIRVGEPGLPDYVTVHPRFPGFFIETKRPGAEPSPAQRKKIQILRAGYRVAVAVADSLDSFGRWLADHERNYQLPPRLQGGQSPK